MALTFLAVAGSPAAMVDALLLVLHEAWAHIAALLGLLVASDEVVARVHDARKVQRFQVTQLRVLLDPDGPTRDVPQVVEPDVLEASHLKDDQRVVVEEVVPADDRKVGEERA